ncbi:MAG: efflux RND transporter periplasmic adaptor subunit [Proteobacteria bacterium]|nr:efflux RND transporter periplasmic adaptor subunit [Pseudomonadota bacterium]
MTFTLPSRYRGWWLAAVAGVVLALCAAAWLALRAPLADVVVVRATPLVRTLQFSARVATLSRVDVGATITGRVAKVRVTEGAQVRQGDVLLELEGDELRAALAQAVAAERQAQARLAGLRGSGRQAARAALAQADATVRAAEAELLRAQQLVAQGFVSASRLDDARRAVDVARAQRDSARAQTQANDDNGTDVLQAEAQLGAARAATQSARARLAQAQVLAPADARVLSRQVEPGQIVQPGKALMSLALAGPTQLEAQVDERFLDQLQTGQKAAVVADAFAGQRFTASVLTIAPAVDAQRGAIEVKFALDAQPPAYLREDMTLSVEVETARRERTLVLPLAALRAATPGASASVLVLRDGRAQTVGITPGLRTLDAVEVLQGLAEGDAVVVGGSFQVGQRLRAREAPWQPGGAVLGAPKADAGAALTNAMGR